MTADLAGLRQGNKKQSLLKTKKQQKGMVLILSEIRGFIMSLIAAATVSALVDGIVPDGGGMKKYLKYLMALVILLILLAPLTELIAALPGITARAKYSYGSVEAMARANSIVAMHIEDSVCSKFALDSGDTEVSFDGENINVRIKRRPWIIAEDVELYILNNFGVSAEVSLYE